MKRFFSYLGFLITLPFAPSVFALDLDKLENVTVRVITNENELTQRSPNILSFPQQFATTTVPSTAAQTPPSNAPSSPTTNTNILSAKPLAHSNQK